MRKRIAILGIVVVFLVGVLFLSTGGARTDVFLHTFEVSEDGKTMTLNVEVTSSAGYIRKMKQTSGSMNPYLTFYSTFGINSKLGAKDEFQIELDENMDEIYFYKGDRGYVKVLEKDKETGEWKFIRNIEGINKFEDYKNVTELKSDKVITTILVKYNDVLYGKSMSIIDYAPSQNEPIGIIDKLIDSQYVPKINGETNVEEILNAKVDYISDIDLILNYNNQYVYFEKIDEENVKSKNQIKNEEYSEAEKYYDYFYENNQIVTLLDNENFSDDDMAAFAVLSLKNPDYENGNKKEEYDEITEKYFGKRINNFNNSKTYIVPETGLIKPTGWSFDSTVFMSLINLTENSDGTKTADFNAINVSDGFWTDSPQKTMAEVKEKILTNKFDEYGPRKVRIKFEEKKDENNNMYIKYLSLEDINGI